MDVTDQPDPDDVATLEARLSAASAAAAGVGEPVELAVLERGPDGGLVGGVYGWTWGGCCELVHLWVEPAARGRGLGRALVAAAEREAARRGCHQVVLLTHASQVGGWYLALGYQEVGRVDDYPAGDTALWYRKLLGTRATESFVKSGS